MALLVFVVAVTSRPGGFTPSLSPTPLCFPDRTDTRRSPARAADWLSGPLTVHGTSLPLLLEPTECPETPQNGRGVSQYQGGGFMALDRNLAGLAGTAVASTPVGQADDQQSPTPGTPNTNKVASRTTYVHTAHPTPVHLAPAQTIPVASRAEPIDTEAPRTTNARVHTPPPPIDTGTPQTTPRGAQDTYQIEPGEQLFTVWF